MSGLPDGWASGTLGDVLKIRNGYAFKSSEFKSSGVPLVRQSNLGGEKVDLTKSVFLDSKYLNERAGFTLIKGDVLIGMSGSVGKLCTYDQDHVALQNQRVGKIELHDPSETDWRFIWHFLKTVTEELLDKAKGVAVANVSPEDIQSLKLDVPPKMEQTRIAAKLDELLAQVDTLKARIDGIPTLLKRFRQSVLAAAVSGRLTDGWRSIQLKEKVTAQQYTTYEISLVDSSVSVEFPASWNMRKLKDVCKIVSGFAFNSKDFVGFGVPAVKISNVQYGVFERKNQEFLPNEFLVSHERFSVHPGDLLMALTRPVTNNTLKVCKYPASGETALLNQRVCKFEFLAGTDKNFFEFLFQSGYFKKQVIGHLSETLQPNLSPKDLSLLAVGVPSEKEQSEIVRRVEQLFAFADQLEARVKTAQTRIDRLTQRILAKAFRGELVPQDPNDEPASVLLERINAQRAAAPKAKRGRKARLELMRE